MNRFQQNLMAFCLLACIVTLVAAPLAVGGVFTPPPLDATQYVGDTWADEPVHVYTRADDGLGAVDVMYSDDPATMTLLTQSGYADGGVAGYAIGSYFSNQASALGVPTGYTAPVFQLTNPDGSHTYTTDESAITEEALIANQYDIIDPPMGAILPGTSSVQTAPVFYVHVPG